MRASQRAWLLPAILPEQRKGVDVKVADTTTITLLNEKAITLGRNQSLDPDALRKLLDPDGVHVCEFTMLHEHQGGRPTNPHMRTRWLLKVKGSDLPQAGLIDIEMEDFDRLNEADEALGG
jgi:hypothetical protein